MDTNFSFSDIPETLQSDGCDPQMETTPEALKCLISRGWGTDMQHRIICKALSDKAQHISHEESMREKQMELVAFLNSPAAESLKDRELVIEALWSAVHFDLKPFNHPHVKLDQTILAEIFDNVSTLELTRLLSKILREDGVAGAMLPVRISMSLEPDADDDDDDDLNVTRECETVPIIPEKLAIRSGTFQIAA